MLALESETDIRHVATLFDRTMIINRRSRYTLVRLCQCTEVSGELKTTVHKSYKNNKTPTDKIVEIELGLGSSYVLVP